MKRATHLLRRALREPLLHFFLLGSAIVFVHHWLAPPTANEIRITEAVLRGLRQEHVRRSGAPPTADEEAGLIQRFIDDEVLYREALAQGLDRGDIIVRRRLVQKMEFVIENSESLPAATDAELQDYLHHHATRYATPQRVAFTHVFVSNDRHGRDAESIAMRLRATLNAGADPSPLGDSFLHGRELSLHTEDEVAAIFGPGFAAQVMTLPAGTWSVPLASSYGVHLVLVTDRTTATSPNLADVRAAVLRDWEEERRAEASRLAVERLRRSYNVSIARVDTPLALAVAQ